MTRIAKPNHSLLPLRKGIKPTSAANVDIFLLGISLLFILLAGSLIPIFREVRTVQGEIRSWEEVVLKAPQGEVKMSPKAEELPTVINQCVQIFKEEEVGIRSYNLERFGEGGVSQTSFFNFALVRFKLEGNWMNLQRGLEKVESLPRQAIQVQEAQLTTGGGEILLKLYFQEPDNPGNP
jgi:hypothetical protein